MTVATRAMPHSTATTGPVPATIAPMSRPSDKAGVSQAQIGIAHSNGLPKASDGEAEVCHTAGENVTATKHGS